MLFNLTRSNLSIKQLSILGFLLVTLPLIASLTYSAFQISKLATFGQGTVLDVANLIESNQKIAMTLERMERAASQYIVLKDPDLKAQYQQLSKQLDELVLQYRAQNTDDRLQELSQKFIDITNIVNNIASENYNDELSLEQIQRYFKALSSTNQAINVRSNELIAVHADQIRSSADSISNILVKSLLVLPLTVVLALYFIFLLTYPFKQLVSNIKNIEKGKFAKPVVFDGAIELEEIAQALERMRTRLHALELQKSSFIRHISHELKTPLAAIREGTELLYDNSLGQLSQNQKEVTNIIRESVNTLQQHIEDLLNFNIVLDSTSLQDAQLVDIDIQIEKVTTAWQLEIKRKQLTVCHKASHITTESNAKQVQVILDNLLSNAIKYSPEHGDINITTSIQDDMAKICIEDHGPGMTESEQTHLFDAFYQGSEPNDDTIKGSGLGLTIVKELTMRLQGDIKINNRINGGVKAELTLPKAKQRR